MKTDDQKAPIEQGLDITYCPGCGWSITACKCLGGGSESTQANTSESINTAPESPAALFEDLILNLYKSLFAKEPSITQTSNTSNISGMIKLKLFHSEMMMLINRLFKTNPLELKLEANQLEKLFQFLEHLQSNYKHPNVLNLAEKLENKLRDYLSAHPNQMRAEYSHLFNKQLLKHEKSSSNPSTIHKHTPFKTKLYPFPSS